MCKMVYGKISTAVIAVAFNVFFALLAYCVLWPTFTNYLKSHSWFVSMGGMHLNGQDDENGPIASSVWCRGTSVSDRVCRFRNLCYSPDADEFVFVQHPTISVVHGLPNWGGSDDNYKFAALTSVEHLNTHHFRLTHLPASVVANITVEFVETSGSDDHATAIFMRPFKPDNLMHVVHDDLIPLFSRLQEQCLGPNDRCFRSFRLVMFDQKDSNRSTPFHFLYSLLTGKEPLHTSDLRRGTIHCFRSAVVGIDRKTVWYQYGFFKSQGPSDSVDGASASCSITIQNFVEHIYSALKIDLQALDEPTPPYVVFFLRESNRLVLNEQQTIDVLRRATSWNVTTVRKVDHRNFASMVRLVRRSEMVVGMHGAALIMALFLRPGRILLELFPYAVPADRYTPYRTMASLPVLNLTYAAWENVILENTVTHPHRSADLGGLDHLPLAEQWRIGNGTSVRDHRCCNDPEWLFRIYQDTVVDLGTFEVVLSQALASYEGVRRAPMPAPHSANLFPGAVRNLSCTRYGLDDCLFLLNWDEPWNAQFVPHVRLGYEIWLQPEGTDDISSILLASRNYSLSCAVIGSYNVWVRCSLDSRTGPMEWIVCSA